MLEDLVEILRSMEESLLRIANSLDNIEVMRYVQSDEEEDLREEVEEVTRALTDKEVQIPRDEEDPFMSEEQLGMIALSKTMGKDYLVQGKTLVIDKAVLQAYGAKKG